MAEHLDIVVLAVDGPPALERLAMPLSALDGVSAPLLDGSVVRAPNLCYCSSQQTATNVTPAANRCNCATSAAVTKNGGWLQYPACAQLSPLCHPLRPPCVV